MEDYVLFVPRLHVGLRCAFRLAHDHCGPASGRRLDRLECGYGALYRFSRLYFLYEGAGGHAVQPRIMLASIEPVTATLLGTLLFHAPIGWTGVAGIALVLTAIIVRSVHRSKGGQK